MRLKPSLELSDAEPMMAASRAKAAELGARVTIALVDETGSLLQLARLDGAKAYSVELAHRKARTSATTGIATSVFEQMAREGRLPTGDILALGGGLPILRDGQCAGAIGVSGTTSADDERIAAAGLAALG